MLLKPVIITGGVVGGNPDGRYDLCDQEGDTLTFNANSVAEQNAQVLSFYENLEENN